MRRGSLLVEHWWTDCVYEIPTYAALRTAGDQGRSPLLHVECDDANYEQGEDDVRDAVVFRELYELADDPFQLRSLHRDPARGPLIQALRPVLTALLTCGDAAGQTRCQDLER